MNFFGLFLGLVLVESIGNMVVAIFLHQQQELEDKTNIAEKSTSRVKKLLDYFCLHLNVRLFLLHFSRSLFCLLPVLQTKWEHRRTFPQSSTTSKQLQQLDSRVESSIDKDMEPRQVEGSLHVALMAAKLFSTIISTIIVNVILVHSQDSVLALELSHR